MSRKQLTASELKGITRHQTELSKSRIKIAMLIDKVQECALGESDMTATQLKAATLLIDKIIPNTSRVESSHEENVIHSIPEATRALLESIAARLPKPEKVIEAEIIDNRDSILQSTDFATISHEMQ